MLKIHGSNSSTTIPGDSLIQMMEWLQTVEMAKLDSAITSKQSREALLDVFGTSMTVSEGSKHSDDMITRDCLLWMNQRNVVVRSLASNGMSEDGLTEQEVTRTALKSSVALKSLFLSNYNYGFQDTLMSNICKTCPNIETLSFLRCNNVKSAVLIAVTHLHQLRHLTITSEVSNDVLLSLSQNCPHLHTVSFSYYSSHLDNEGIKRLTEGCPGLTDITIKGQDRIDDDAIHYIAKNCCHLTALCIENCSKITDMSLVYLADLSLNLTSLDVSYCYGITDYSVVLLATKRTTLSHLNLSECPCITDIAICVLAEMRYNTLTSLKLGGCYTLTNIALYALAQNMCRLKTLVLTFNSNITDEAVLALIRCCKELVHIDFCGCNNITLSLGM